MKTSLLPLAILSWALACTGHQHAAAPAPGDWRLLFDGTSTAAWRGFKMDSLPAGWQIVEGTLTRVAGGGDIVTREEFANFELTLDWRVAPGGNSGIMFRVSEAADATYETGPELQVLDDAGHRDGQSRLTAAGSNYALDAAPAGVVNAADQWNAIRLVVNGAQVEHWLNGVKVVAYELWTPEWRVKVAASKFRQWGQYGLNRSGHIALQDHGDRVSYRNIRIRVLP